MTTEAFIRNRVARYYWRDDSNCATTTLNILAEHFDPANPPHLCEDLTCEAIGFSIEFVQGALKGGGVCRSSGQAPDRSENHLRHHVLPFSGNQTAPRT